MLLAVNPFASIGRWWRTRRARSVGPPSSPGSHPYRAAREPTAGRPPRDPVTRAPAGPWVYDDAHRRWSLIEAAFAERVDLARALLDAGCDPNARVADVHGIGPDAEPPALDRRAGPSAYRPGYGDDDDALHFALCGTYTQACADLVALLLERGARVRASHLEDLRAELLHTFDGGSRQIWECVIAAARREGLALDAHSA